MKKLQRIVFTVTFAYLFYLFVHWGLAYVEVRGQFLGVGSLSFHPVCVCVCVSWEQTQVLRPGSKPLQPIEPCRLTDCEGNLT